MKQATLLFPLMNILLLSLVFTSCKKGTTELLSSTSTEEFATAKSGGNPNTLPVISLRVTVNDAAGNNIISDGKGDYINGLDYVQAVLDQFGTFAFNTLNANSPKTIAKRWVTYNFNSPIDAGNTYRPDPSNSKNCHFSTGGSVYGTNPYIPIQNLGTNGNPASECIYMGNSVANSSMSWRVSFHKGNEDNSTSPTAFAVVTRTSINPDIWTITPVGTCSANSNVAALRSDDGSFLYGYYNIPFFFTLTKI
jgi:hypothetical protein